jgi:NodT family efflux transporter outer membrane factor (OMF) lipoprotein
MEAGVEGDWWNSFNDPGLDQTVRLVLVRNHDLKAAAARVDQAAALARIAGADLKPTLDLGFNPTRRRMNFIGFPIGGGSSDVVSTTTTQYGLSLNTTWEVDLWGRLGDQTAAALADLQAAENDFYGACLSLAGQTVKTWLAIGEAEQQKALAKATVESYRTSAKQVQSRYEKGLRPSLDVRLSLTSLNGAEALFQNWSQQLDSAKRQLELLLGRYPGGKVMAPAELAELPSAIPGGLPAELVARRPDLCAAERRFAASQSRWSAAKSALYPRLSLTASGGTASEDLKDLLDLDFRVWSLAANLVQPLFQGDRLRAGRDQAEAAAQEALEKYAGAVLNAYAEVESALAAEGFLIRRESSLAEAAEQAEAAKLLADDRYQSGLEDYITVLESQRRALESQSALLTVRRLRLENRVDLYLALGGGFEGFKLDDSKESQP